jgi:hypothetical protein
MAFSLADLKTALDAMAAKITEVVLDAHKSELADNDAKYNHLLSQVQLLLGKAENGGGGGAEKKAVKRIVAAAEPSNTSTGTTSEYPNLNGIADKYVTTIKSFLKRRVRNTYLKVRAALDTAWYESTIPDEFRTEHENSNKAEKAKKAGVEALREYVAAQWWEKNKGVKSYEEDVKKEMNTWIEMMLQTSAAVEPTAMENE